MEAQVTEIFEALVKELIELLPDFGENLGIDDKAIPTHANPHQESKPDDGRRDNDTDYGVKTYRGKNEDGTKWEKTTSWFGYNLHLVVDTNYELPVVFSVTKASAAEAPEAHRLLGQMEQSEPALLERCEYFTADRGYDDSKLIVRLRDHHNIKPIIDIRNMWKDGDNTRVLTGKTMLFTTTAGMYIVTAPKKGR